MPSINLLYVAHELYMKRIAIIGPPGAGKTTLAKELALILGIKACHLDRLFWQRGWKGKTGDTRIDILQNFVLRNEWIIEGTYLRSSGPRLEAADTIIFLDIPPFLCLQRIIKRHWEHYGPTRRDIPEGCKDRLTLFRMLKVLTFPLSERRKLEKNLRIYESGEHETKRVIRLHSDEEVKAFLAEQQNVLNKVTPAKESPPGSSGAMNVSKEKMVPFTPPPQTCTRSSVRCG